MMEQVHYMHVLVFYYYYFSISTEYEFNLPVLVFSELLQ